MSKPTDAVSPAPSSAGQAAASLALIDDELENRVIERSGFMVGSVAGIVFVGALILAFYIYVTYGGNIAREAPATPGVIVLSLAVVVLTYLRKMRLAILTFTWGILASSVYAAVNLGGMHTPALLAFPVIATAMGLMLGQRAALFTLGAALLMLGALAWLHTAGALPPVVLRTPAGMFLTYFVTCSAGSTLGILTMRNLREQFRQSVQLGHDLADLNAHLEDKVRQRTAELSTALEKLKQTQDDLIQAEKLASLGSMVAGIAHELNTPLGNALMVATTLQTRSAELNAAVQSGTVKKSEMIGGLGAVNEMSGLIEKSISRAASLVASFKRVAVDQVSEHRRSYDLRETVEENLASLRPGFKHQPWVITNEVPEGIVCDGFPGPLGQVLVNLIQNAILHGFSGRDHGTVRVNAMAEAGRIILTVADDGVGMDTATSVRIFEPFFTTKLGQGGSGLGLAICYRIVNTILAGEIQTVSLSGTGTQFIITFPQRTPGKL